MTLATELIAALDPIDALGQRVFLDSEVPSGTDYPYVTLLMQPYDPGPPLHGDRRSMAFTLPVQVDVWQLIGDEDETVPQAVRARLNGLRLSAPRMHVQVRSVVRVPEPPPILVTHHAITVETVEVE